jgi:hypothetical protein
MQAHRTERIIQPNGTLILENLPFEAGDKVEVIVLEIQPQKEETDNPLRGTLLKYEDPFEPAVPLEDWEVLK